jgi:NADH-quinone oxidoreductase subunit H
MQVAGIAIEPWMLQAAALLAKCILVFTIIMTGGAVLSWVERKQSALIQDRLGANRADLNILGRKITAKGLVFMLTDGIKGITKEDYIPPKASAFLHTLAPFIVSFCAAAAFVVLPFGGSVELPWIGHVDLCIAPSEVGLLLAFAILSMGVYGVVLAGIVSDNKFATLGALRGTAQLISYEVTLGLTLMGSLMLYHSLDLSAIVARQGHMIHLFGWALPIPAWGVFLQPLGFLLFLAATVVENKRIPFDLPEGESEIIGYFLEYSGMKALIFMMSEYIESIFFSWLVVVLFFGGWQLPGLHLEQAGQSGFFCFGHLVLALPFWGAVAVAAAGFAAKVGFFIWLFMQVRWTLPRFRYDQLMHLGWKIMLPLSLANLALTALLAYSLKP